MNIWLVMLAGGLVTFAMRFSFIYLFGRLRVPTSLAKALEYVPPAVLSAIVFPELILRDGAPDLSPGNPRLVAGLAAVVAAVLGKNTLLTIAAGLAAFVLARALGAA